MTALNFVKIVLLLVSIVLVFGVVIARATTFKSLEFVEYQAFYGSMSGFISVLINSYVAAQKRKKA